MYHCHVNFYLLGRRHELFDPLTQTAPLEAFTHTFSSSLEPERTLAQQADAIFADLRDMDALSAARLLSRWKRPEAELILLMDKDQAAVLEDCDCDIADVWTLPMSASELRFHFLKWQRDLKLRKDFWQSSQYLETVINSSPDLVWYKNKDGVHEKVNDSFCKTVGKTKAQVQGRRHAYIWDVEQDDPVCIESERKVMESGRTLSSEEIIQTGEGVRTLNTYKSPLYDLDGSTMGTVGVAIDVTQERAYAQELLKKSQTLEALFTTLDCGVMCHTLDGSQIISINRAALRILGYSSAEELQKDDFDMVANSVLHEDKPRLMECIRSLKKVGDNVNIEYRVRHTSGETLYVLGNVKIIEKDGQLLYQRYMLDFTTQKLREEQERRRIENRQMELTYALCIEYNMVCYFDLSTGKGRVLRSGGCPNGILDPIFQGKLDLRECMSRYIDISVYDEDKEALRLAVSREHMAKVLLEKPIYFFNYRTTCCGRVRYFQMKAVRAGEWNGSRGIVLGFRSVDEETRADREQKALLEDALSQANRASKAKSTFLSNMSHDIRTPMNAIIGFTALAISHIDRKEQVEEYLKKIMSSGNHLLSLINDILDMSRIESGKIHLNEAPCSLPDILHELRNILQVDIHAKQLDLYMDAVDVRHENICCDRLRLNQVLLNLMSNAVKYTGAGGTVSIKVIEKGGAPAGYANYEFHVKDTGIGMSEEFVARIFEPFERERNSTISGIQGTGLGMAITKNIVEMMNGTIEVKSKKGVGTECIVKLALRTHAENLESAEIEELSGLRALVVDDDFNTCDTVTSMLQQIGLRAEWTLSGKEAVLRTRQAVNRDDSYFVYIIDWMLPDMNGVEVARRIRQEVGKDVPIIVLTAYDWSDIEDEARRAGVTGFCSKPLFFSELRNCLGSILNVQKRGANEDAAPQHSLSGRILLVEDNELNQEIAVEILGEAGLTAEVAENGQVAVDKLQASEPGYYQLVLMDIQMPVMNGYEAAKAIRALENRQLASIPILAMTANAFEEDKQAALSSGMDGHIAKPIDIKKLLDTLATILK